MRERGMIFNAEMVRAILDGRKTQTRRVVKPQPFDRSWSRNDHQIEIVSGRAERGDEIDGLLAYTKSSGGTWSAKSPFGQPGDRLWVRETWGVASYAFDDDGMMIKWTPDRPATAIHEMPFGNGYYSGHVIYAADGKFTWGDDDGYEDGRSCWKPSIHMPRAASRINLEIKDIRVERLNNINERDAANEGLHQLPASGRYCLTPGAQYFGMASHSAKEVFSWLWESIYGAESWDANPWVWVIEFKQIK